LLLQLLLLKQLGHWVLVSQGAILPR